MKICPYCGTEFDQYETLGVREREFCSDNCRYDYHNTKRKIDRAIQAICAKIELIEVEIQRDNDLSLYAAEEMLKIGIKPNIGLQWECVNCGQYQFEKPSHGDRCNFCQSNKWKMKLSRWRE